MLHPVGPLPTVVYWRRRLLVLGLVLAVVGGGGWLVVGAVNGRHGLATAAATAPAPAPAPGTPTTPPALPACADAALTVDVQAPPTAAAAGKPTFELRITNSSPASCTRPLDPVRREIVLLDAAGRRVWSSNDCTARGDSEVRTLAAGETVAFPAAWSGLTSEPTCSVPGTAPAPGPYVLRGRLDTRTTPDRPLVLS